MIVSTAEPALTAPVTAEWSMSYPMVHGSVPLIRLHLRRQLAEWEWTGDQYDATLIASELATNAIHHGRIAGHTMLLRLTVLEDGVLLIDMSDPVPAFHGIGRTAEADLDDERGRGLDLVRGLGGEVSSFLRAGGVGKTVRVRLKVPA